MSVRILQREAEVQDALIRLQSRGLQPRRGGGDLAWSLRYVLRAGHRPPLPDPRKSWDLELTIREVEAAVPKSAAIVDLGAWNSAVPPALLRLGYRRLHGVDLDPRLENGPFAGRIAYHVADFHSMPFLETASIAAVTAVSTIEHGWRPDLLGEVGRVLTPGGLFLASTDYWPDKIDTSDATAFGMSWSIFSAAEIEELLAGARDVGLSPIGPIELRADQRVITWNGRQYTFAHLALRKE